MCDEASKDLEFQINKVFENMGGSLLSGTDRGRSIDHLMAHPFFIGRGGVVPVNSGRTRSIVTNIQPAFDMGIILGTPGFKSKVASDEAVVALTRHAIGDWGDLCIEDRKANDEAVKEGLRILSAYKSTDGVKFWIITEADRSVTTALLPEEY